MDNLKNAEMMEEELDQVAGGKLHYVQRGETLNTLADRYGTTVEEICKLNNIENPDKIQANWFLTMPNTRNA